MTDQGRRARWTSLVVLGPAAAGVFAGATTWAAGHAPGVAVPTGSAATSSEAAGVGGDPQQVLDDEAARIATLEGLVVRLRSQVAALDRAPTTPGPAARVAPASPGRVASRPPPVHTVTGAS
jgi:hypothetical protein